MSVELLAALLVLALIDSTSFGTLLIPLWLMLSPGRPQAGRLLLFLGTVAVFYLLLGLALLLGASSLADIFQDPGTARALHMAELALGIGLMVLGVCMDPWTAAGKARRAARRAEQIARSGPSLHMRMRARAADAAAPVGAVMLLAVLAAAIEAASMLPYLAAIGLLTASSLSLPARGLVLSGYCLVMIAPALLLLAARLLLHDRVAPVLARLEAWLSQHANEALAWVVFLVGLFLAGEGVSALD